MLLYERLDALRKQKGIKWGFLEQSINAYRGKFTDLKKGKTSLSDAELSSICAVLDTTPEYLKGQTDTQKKPSAESEGLDKQLEGIDFALYGEARDLTEQEKEDVLNFIRFTKNKRGG